MSEKYYSVHDIPDICPVCGEPAVAWCKCMTRHSFCKNKHDWHTETRTRKELQDDGRVHVVETWFILVVDEKSVH